MCGVSKPTARGQAGRQAGSAGLRQVDADVHSLGISLLPFLIFIRLKNSEGFRQLDEKPLQFPVHGLPFSQR